MGMWGERIFEKGILGLPWRSGGKESACQCGRHSSIPGWGRFHTPQGNQACTPPVLKLCSRAREPQGLKAVCCHSRAPQA